MRNPATIQRLTILFILLLLFGGLAQAQPQKKRILFVLDASGSMEGKLEGKRKFDIARELLTASVDSIERANPDIEFALRVYGHQSPREANNCEDSKLEIAFRTNNSKYFRQFLDQVKIQGQTPIAYSLFQAAQDFPNDPKAQNVIVLITDGLETCDGDPCAVKGVLSQYNIAFKPFIIGMGMGEEGKDFFDCVGPYFDATDEQTFENALYVVISQAMNVTTAQVNLIDQHGEPVETNVNITFYDKKTGEARYNFVHALDRLKRPDTLYLNPVDEYNMIVHTTPPVTVQNIQLNPGKHNVIAADVPQGLLRLIVKDSYGFSDVQALVRQNGQQDILEVQGFNTEKKYLTGFYDLEILTLPRLYYQNVKVDQEKVALIVIPPAGTLAIESSQNSMVGVFHFVDGKPELLYEFEHIYGRHTVNLQPGTYTVVHRPDKFQNAEMTETKEISIYPRRTTTVRF